MSTFLSPSRYGVGKPPPALIERIDEWLPSLLTGRLPTARAVSRLPVVRRDLAVVVADTVPVQEIRAADYSNERGNPPSDAYDVSCRDESREVCEQKTIDKGNGYSEVVEDCHDETEQYCSYTVDEWTTIQTYTLDGNDLHPVYESPNIASGQRLGDKSEELIVTFSLENGEQETYSPGTVSEFQQFTVGSNWTLKMNALGGVVGVEP